MWVGELVYLTIISLQFTSCISDFLYLGVFCCILAFLLYSVDDPKSIRLMSGCINTVASINAFVFANILIYERIINILHISMGSQADCLTARTLWKHTILFLQ